MGSGTRWVGRVGVAVAMAAMTLLLTATPALAHDVLVGTAPRNGESVARTPAAVVLTFDQPAIAMGTELVVTGPGGEVQRGPARLVDNTVTQDLDGGAPAGRYAVSWRVTSADGHPVSGTFSFTSAAAGTGTPAGASSPGANATGGAQPTPRRAVPNGWAWLVLVALVVAGVAIAQRGARLGGSRSRGEGDPRP